MPAEELVAILMVKRNVTHILYIFLQYAVTCYSLAVCKWWVKNALKGFYFNLATTQQMKVILVIMIFYTIMMRKMIHTGIMWFSTQSHWELELVLLWYCYKVCLFAANAIKLFCLKLKKISIVTTVAIFQKLCLDQEVGLPVLEINNRRRCFCKVLYECYAVFLCPCIF